MRTSSAILTQSKSFSLRIIKLYSFLCKQKKEFVLSKQILRSGTSIGANAKEATYAQSRADFYSKLHISLKEAAETEYWLEILHEGGYIEDEHFKSIHSDCLALIRILTSILKTKDN